MTTRFPTIGLVGSHSPRAMRSLQRSLPCIVSCWHLRSAAESDTSTITGVFGPQNLSNESATPMDRGTPAEAVGSDLVLHRHRGRVTDPSSSIEPRRRFEQNALAALKSGSISRRCVSSYVHFAWSES
jgi:hypothetical protein